MPLITMVLTRIHLTHKGLDENLGDFFVPKCHTIPYKSYSHSPYNTYKYDRFLPYITYKYDRILPYIAYKYGRGPTAAVGHTEISKSPFTPRPRVRGGQATLIPCPHDWFYTGLAEAAKGRGTHGVVIREARQETRGRGYSGLAAVQRGTGAPGNRVTARNCSVR